MKSDELIRFDWAIKYLLRDKANFDVLNGFLSAVLSKKVIVLNLLESESNQDDEKDKLNRVDLLVQIDSDELVLIEVQVESELDFFHRIVFGTSKLITDNMELGDAYREIKKVISISITYFNLGRGTDYLYRGSTNFVGVHTKDILAPSPNQKKAFKIDEIKQIFPEHYVIRVQKFGSEVKSAIDEWVYMLKHSKIEPEFESEHIQTASKKLNYMQLDEEKQRAYRHFMDNESYHNSMIWSSRQEGRIEGRDEGRYERDLEVIRNSLEAGLPLETIAVITQLDVSEIEQIKEQLERTDV